MAPESRDSLRGSLYKPPANLCPRRPRWRAALRLAKEWASPGRARSSECPGRGAHAVCALRGRPLPSSAHGQGGRSPGLSALVTGIRHRLGVISERGPRAVGGAGRPGAGHLGGASAPCRPSQGCSPRRRAPAAALPSAPRRPGSGPGLAEKTAPEASPPRRPARHPRRPESSGSAPTPAGWSVPTPRAWAARTLAGAATSLLAAPAGWGWPGRGAATP